MKFGQQLENSLWPEWKFYYIDYDGLKRELKKRTAKGPFTESDEAAFVEILERELEKVAAFRKLKGDELARRVQHAEAVVDSVLHGGASSSSSKIDIDAAPNAEDQHEENELRLAGLEQECNRIITELTELAKFTRLNYSGFLKILKKHDKHTYYNLKPMFMVRLNQRPFYKESFDKLILKISRLYDIVRTGGQPNQPVSADPNAGSQQFVRKTTKYWVHPDNVTELKCIILKYLPVLVFSSKGGKEYDPAITSIYFDNDSFDLYTGRIEKNEGAEAIRFRWYGNMDQQEIFIERKTHREDWTGEKSVKQRFSIKEKYVNEFMYGTYNLKKALSKLKERGNKSDKELQEMEQLATEIQDAILNKKLHPMVRTFYNRTAFQLPGDARVRISLDTELSMIREDNFDKQRSGTNWRRTDVGTDYPFSYLPEDEIVRFPYAILEVKLQTQLGTEAPEWVDALVKSHLVEEVPKFSKFIHGVSTLLENRVSLLPFWLPQMDKDIRKPALLSANPLLSSSASIRSTGTPERRAVTNNTTSPIDLRRKSKDKKKVDNDVVEIVVDSTSEAPTEHTPLLNDDELSPSAPSDNNPRSSLRRRKIGMFKWNSLFSKKKKNSMLNVGDVTNRISQQQGKRIALPVRVEPKVFFANERTYLQWLNFCITLGGLALGLLNFGDRIGQITGLIFTLIAFMFMIYATFLFQWRAQMIRNKNPGPYDDRFGPTVLVVVLFFGVLINFWLKLANP